MVKWRGILILWKFVNSEKSLDILILKGLCSIFQIIMGFNFTFFRKYFRFLATSKNFKLSANITSLEFLLLVQIIIPALTVIRVRKSNKITKYTDLSLFIVFGLLHHSLYMITLKCTMSKSAEYTVFCVCFEFITSNR